MKTPRKASTAIFNDCAFLFHKGECLFTALVAGTFDLADWQDTEKEV